MNRLKPCALHLGIAIDLGDHRQVVVDLIRFSLSHKLDLSPIVLAKKQFASIKDAVEVTNVVSGASILDPLIRVQEVVSDLAPETSTRLGFILLGLFRLTTLFFESRKFCSQSPPSLLRISSLSAAKQKISPSTRESTVSVGT